jgi:transcriptional regulator with XRE-family HTH domain
MPKQGIKVNREKIKNLRQNLGFTQEELGGTAMEGKGFKKISLRTVQKIENDSDYLCSLKIIDNLSKIFDVPVNELLADEIFEDRKDLDDKGSNPLIDEKFQKESSIPKQNLTPNVDQEIGEITDSADNQDDYNNVEIDWDREFYLDESVLDHLESHWESDQACGAELWEYDPGKAKIIDKLREFKFSHISFKKLWESVGDDLDEDVYRLFHRHSYTPDYTTIHFREDWDIDNVTGERILNDSAYRFDKGVNNFFESLSRTHFYSIDYDLPKDDETLEIMYKLISGIENYFEQNTSVAEGLKFKYHYTSLREELLSRNISIFSSTTSSKKVGIGKNHGQVFLKAFHLRIIIKNWSNIDVKDLQNCRDRLMKTIVESFTRVEWRDFIEIEKNEDE